MDKVFIFKSQSRPNHVKLWVGNQINFSTLGTKPLLITSDRTLVAWFKQDENECDAPIPSTK
jgi:hypothetical protein